MHNNVINNTQNNTNSSLRFFSSLYFIILQLDSPVFTAVLIMSSMIPLTILSLDTDEAVG